MSHSSPDAAAPPDIEGRAVIYRLARELSAIPDDLRLRSVEWGVLLSVTGEHSAAQIGDAFGLGGAERRRVFSRLLEHGLVEERPVTYGEYLRATATSGDDRPHDLHSFLRAGVALPPAVAPVAGRAGDEDGRDLTRPVRTEPPPVPFTPLQTPRLEAAARRLSLRVLMRHIMGRAPDVDSGQLDVYRVFIRVDTKLLKRNGIDTLRFEDDRVVDDPELQRAIGRSLERTLGMAMPADAFV